MKNLVFFGTPDFVLPICESLLKTKDFRLVGVVTNPDKPVGRHAYRQAGKQILTPSPVKQWALDHKIPSYTISHLPFTIIQPDLGILAAYGQIIPQSIIDLFPKGILIIHPSLLPKYRGASPAVGAILANDQETGVSIIKMDAEMDHGPIVYQFKSLIKPDDTSGSLYQRLFQETASRLPQVLNDWTSAKIKAQEQNHQVAIYTKRMTKNDGFIPYGIIAPKRGPTSKCKLGWDNLKTTPENIERFIRALSPWPGVWTEMNKKRLKILKAHLESGKLVLDQVQLEGKNPVSWKQFQEAYPKINLF